MSLCDSVLEVNIQVWMYEFNVYKDGTSLIMQQGWWNLASQKKKAPGSCSKMVIRVKYRGEILAY